MTREGFDTGGGEVSEVSFVNPEVGLHVGRITGFIHLGSHGALYKGKRKKEANACVMQIVLLEEHDLVDGEYLTISKDFYLKSGDMAYMTKLLDSLDPKQEKKSLKQFIGMCIQVNLTGGKDKGDDGKPKYVDMRAIPTPVHPGLVEKYKAIKGLKSFGIVPFDKLTEEVIKSLNPYREVHGILTESSNYPGSVAQEIITKIRKDDPEFATFKEKDKKDSDSSGSADGYEQPKAEELDEEETFDPNDDVPF